MNETTVDPTDQRFRFTLRSMFIALSLASAAVWLFLRYKGIVGLFFVAAILLAGWCVLRANRVGAAGCLVVFAVAWVALQFFGPYTILRNRAVWVVGTNQRVGFLCGMAVDFTIGASTSDDRGSSRSLPANAIKLPMESGVFRAAHETACCLGEIT